MACGTRLSLVELAAAWNALSADGAATYVRLNISRAVRLAEQNDLVASLKPDHVSPEPE